MSNNPMLKFTDINLETPVKRISEGRVDDFNEIYKEYASDKAEDQASRCSQCGVPYCQSHCPLHNNIPDWLKLTTQGRLKEAYTLSQKTNSFPEICGRICPQDRLCEGNCVIEQSGHGTVTIGSIEKYITDTAWKNGWVKPITPKIERDETVAIIGAGPGGLAAAATLRKNGLKVNIYDRYDRAGGLMTYGIPSFKLEKDVVSKRVTQLNDSGVNFHLNCNVGKDISSSGPDSIPVISASPHFENAYFGFGHGHLGLTQSAITGALLVALADDKETPVDCEPYRIDRRW